MNELTPVERLQLYHSSPKIKCGIAYIAAPEPTPPKPVKPDPVAEAQKQIAQAYWGIAQAYKNL